MNKRVFLFSAIVSLSVGAAGAADGGFPPSSAFQFESCILFGKMEQGVEMYQGDLCWLEKGYHAIRFPRFYIGWHGKKANRMTEGSYSYRNQDDVLGPILKAREQEVGAGPMFTKDWVMKTLPALLAQRGFTMKGPFVRGTNHERSSYKIPEKMQDTLQRMGLDADGYDDPCLEAANEAADAQWMKDEGNPAFHTEARLTLEKGKKYRINEVSAEDGERDYIVLTRQAGERCEAVSVEQVAAK